MLELIHRPEDQLAVLNRIAELFRHGADTYRAFASYRPGGEEHEFYWHPELDQPIWALAANDERDHFWISCGVTGGKPGQSHRISVQFNPRKIAPHNLTAGAFVRDHQGNAYIAHSGGIGGGKSGVGKSAFLDYWCEADMVDITCPEEPTRRMILVASLDSPRFLQQIAHFVHEVARFKLGGPRIVLPAQEDQGFTPEFQGTRKGYQPTGVIEASCDHGVVVSALAKVLESRSGFRLGNDRHRDLYLISATGHIPVLFEVKTDLSTTSLYTGLGQLMLHGAYAEIAPQRILVVPGEPDAATKGALSRLGVAVLPYTWKGSQPEFMGLAGVLDPALNLRP